MQRQRAARRFAAVCTGPTRSLSGTQAHKTVLGRPSASRISGHRLVSTSDAPPQTRSVSKSEFAAQLEAIGINRDTIRHFFHREHAQSVAPSTNQHQRAYPFAVALSGGADSMAMMLLLKEYLDEQRITTPLLAITVDHALRQESAEEARFVGEIATRVWGVKHVIQQCDWQKDDVNGAPRKSKLQEQARSYRYKLLTQACHQYGVQCLFVGHNLGDQLETVLFRLGRASGINGLAGIAARSFLVGKQGDANAVALLRPLLGVSKPSMKATCERFQQSWVEDPSNESLVFDRIRIRKALDQVEQDPTGERDMATLVEFHYAALRAKQDFELRETQLLDKHVLVSEPNHIVVSTGILSDQTCFDELAMRILSTLVRCIGGRDAPPRLSSVQRLLQDLRSLGSGKTVTLSGCRITKKQRGNELHFQRERPQPNKQKSAK